MSTSRFQWLFLHHLDIFFSFSSFRGISLNKCGLGVYLFTFFEQILLSSLPTQKRFGLHVVHQIGRNSFTPPGFFYWICYVPTTAALMLASGL